MKITSFGMSALIALTCLFSSVEAKESIAVEKGYNECHHAAYGQGRLLVQPEAPIPFSIGKIPLTKFGPLRNIKSLEGGTFTIKHTGTYTLHYFFKLLGIGTINEETLPEIVVGVKVNDVLVNYCRIPLTVLISTENGAVGTFKQHTTFLHNLRKGDTVHLSLESVPGGFSFSHPAPPAENLPDTAAYLVIEKAERNH